MAHELEFIPYPTPGQSNDVAEFKIQYHLPDYVILPETKPLLGWWDEKLNRWRMDGISALRFDRSTRFVEVGLKYTRPFAMIQERNKDFPYLKWSLKPTGYDAVNLSLKGARFTVVFSIKAGKAALIEPKASELKNHGLLNTYMTPGLLLLKLKRCGLNLLPVDEDRAFSKKPARDDELETHLNEQLAMVSPCFEIHSSPFNTRRLKKEKKALFAVQLKHKIDAVLLEDSKQAVRLPFANPDQYLSDEKGGDMKEEDDEEEDEQSGFGSGFSSIPAFGMKVEKKPETSRSRVYIMGNTEHFIVVDYDKRKGPLNTEARQGEIAHCNLRRLLVAHYSKFKLGYDLGALISALDQRESTLQTQEAVSRMLNLTRVLAMS